MTKTKLRTGLRRGACAVAALTVVALAAAGAARPTTPGSNGLIVYAEEIGGRFQLFTIRPDGSGRTRLTNVRGAFNPDWAPNGRSIVFELESKNRASVAVMTADGEPVRNLTPSGFQGQPSYAPDGKWIVYEREAGGNGIWLMRANGTALRRLTRNPFAGEECGCDTDPNFSPDGRLVSFVRVKKDAKLQALFVVRRDGTGLRRLMPYTWEIAIKHDWAPDGKLILLTRNADFVQPGKSANIITIRPDGSGLAELTKFTGAKENAFAGSFSPDGKQIVFRYESGDNFSLAVMDRDGANLRRLTTGPGKPRFIDWGTHP